MGIDAPSVAMTAPPAPALLKWGGLGLAGAGAATALASLPAHAVKPKLATPLLLAGLGAAAIGVGALTAWRMQQDADDAAAGPRVVPGDGAARSNDSVPRTVTGISGRLPGVSAPTNAPHAELETVADGLGQLVQVTNAPGDDGLWLVEKSGKLLRRDEDGSVETKLDISSIVDGAGERGLLSVAFHPNFESNGRLFVYYTEQGSGELHVAEAMAGADGVVERDSLHDLMAIDHPRGNHNGGQLQFGPDGMLYAGTGDGGAGGDPDDNGQHLGSHLGKILRIDVDSPSNGKPYGIPADNPYVDVPGAQPEIYATGVRNPWRFSFDREHGDLWIGDVGQNSWEEVDYAPRGQARGANFGWDAREGAQAYRDSSESPTRPTTGPGRLIDPALQYGRDEGFSITGGYVYRGDEIPALQGYYLYSDIGSDTVRAMKVEDGKVVDRREFPGGREYTVSYGEGPDGELYAVTLGGELTKVVGEGRGIDAAGDPTPTGPAEVVDIGVRDGSMRFDRTEYRVRSGAVTLRLANTDSSGMSHNVGIQGNGIRGQLSDMAKRGDTVELTAQLEPGEYQLACSPHMGGGMVAKLIVE